ncbi:hypothetical protein [Xanthobacter sp.]|uniref:hypothetical protein n=1 Tax=Xanthobacter sp. TaxID=35809 RepID=UPI0025DC6E08|nr:hypothetical protein [Xanthobacter sp.]
MKKAFVLACLISACVPSAWASAADMTLDFTWLGTTLCAPRPSSPEFQVDNVPAGTTKLRFALMGPTGRELGGADVQLPARGAIPKGAVTYRSPCVGGIYTWTVEAIDADGKRLGSASLARPFY